jgi:hypothetical protein
MLQTTLSFDTSGAQFSDDHVYRYALWRRWGHGPQVCFIMLNPSIADATANDPTITRCIGFAQSQGFDQLIVGNLFALISTDPKQLKKAVDPVGPDNDRWLKKMVDESDLVIAAWGVHGSIRGRDKAVRAMIPNLYVLNLTTHGQPRHPLYLKGDLCPKPWR